MWPRAESATRTVASPPAAGAVSVVSGAVAAGVVGAWSWWRAGGGRGRRGLRLGECLLEGGQRRRVDGAGGFDAERDLELLEGGGQFVGPDAVDGALPEAGQREHGLNCSGVGQVGGRRLTVELGQQLVDRLGGGSVDEPGLAEAAIGLQSLHGFDGGRAIDPVDRTLVEADALQLGLQCRRVRRHLLDRLGLLLVAEAARVEEQPEPCDLERERSRVVLRGRLRQWGRRGDPFAGSGEIVLGLLDALDRGRCNERGSRRGRRRRRADRHARRGGDRRHQCCLRVSELLACCGEGGLRLLDLVDRRRHVLRGSTRSAPRVWMSPTVAASSVNNLP